MEYVHVFRITSQDRLKSLQCSWEQVVPVETISSYSKASDIFHFPDLSPIDVLVVQDALTLLFPHYLHFCLCQSSSLHSLKTRCWFLMPHVPLQAWPLCPLHTNIADCSRHSHAILTMSWNEILAVHRTNNNFVK